MRVICASADEFIACLEMPGETVFQNAIRVSINKTPVGKDLIKEDVYIAASAVMQSENAEYFLEYGKKCGTDYTDGGGEADGTALAEAIKEKIRQAADQRGLRLLPGVLDY